MTLNDLASKVGSDVGNLSRIERGTQMPSKDLAEKICTVLGSDLTEMHLFFPERYPDFAITPTPAPDAVAIREAKGSVLRTPPDASKVLS